MPKAAADYLPSSVSADEALTKLNEGNARFANAAASQSKPTAARRAETAQAQYPFAVILGCSDSRTSPEIVFDQNIGDLFVIRNAGNLVNDHVLGSIEFAVKQLGVRLVVVKGHQRCGAVSAVLAGSDAGGHIQSLVRDIQPAVQAVKGKPGCATRLAVAENARLMAEKIRTKADFGAVAKDVRVISAVYDLDSGKVDFGKE